MSTRNFFEERNDGSEAKARIVSKYFKAWANVVVHAKSGNVRKIAYIDLFAGPGRYADGAVSTPLMVLRTAINNPKIAMALQAYFNDVDSNNTRTLQDEIESLTGLSSLKYQPIVHCGEVNVEAAEVFAGTQLVPSFTFFDPWGYKGFSLRLLQSVIKDWGCDSIFFFNYNRINPGISNDKVSNHMNALFGEKIANKLRQDINLESVNPDRRETLIVSALIDAIKGVGGKFVLPFRFKNAERRLTHHLIFVSKHFRGYEIMKDIMATESSTLDQNVPSFTYSPADRESPLLFSLQRPIDDLKDMLLMNFEGQEIEMYKIYREHSVDKPYTKKNYKSVLSQMEEEKLITVRSNAGKKRRQGTFADHLIVKF